MGFTISRESGQENSVFPDIEFGVLTRVSPYVEERPGEILSDSIAGEHDQREGVGGGYLLLMDMRKGAKPSQNAP